MAEEKGGECDACYRYVEKLLRCSQCKEAVYCSRSCQSQAWKAHKTVCKPVANPVRVKEREAKEAEAKKAPQKSEEELEEIEAAKERSTNFRKNLLRITQETATEMLAKMQQCQEDFTKFLPDVKKQKESFHNEVTEQLRKERGLAKLGDNDDPAHHASAVCEDLMKEVLMAMLRRGGPTAVSTQRDLLEIGNNYFNTGLVQQQTPESYALPDDAMDGFERAVAQVNAKGFVCVEGLLDEEIATVIYDECQSKFWNNRDKGALNPSGSPIIDGYGCWVSYPARTCLSPELTHALRLIFGITHEISKGGYPVKLKVPSMAYLGCLPPGSAREDLHLDNSGSSARELTVVLFCNPGWTEEDKGEFRGYFNAQDQPALRPVPGESDSTDARNSGGYATTDGSEAEADDEASAVSRFKTFLPEAGKCLIFQSRKLWHEVAAAKRMQFALTLYINRAD